MILQNDNSGVSSRCYRCARAGERRDESDSYRPRFSPSAAISKKTRGRATAPAGGLGWLGGIRIIISYE